MNRTRRGFTLIELLVIVAILGILIGVTLVFVSDARNQAREKSITNALRQFGLQMEVLSGSPPAGYTGLCADPSIKNIGNSLSDLARESPGACFVDPISSPDYTNTNFCGCYTSSSAWLFKIKLDGLSGLATCISTGEFQAIKFDFDSIRNFQCQP